MNHHQTGPLEEGWETVLPRIGFNVTVIYETEADGMRAKQFVDQFASRVAGGRSLTLNLNVWNLRLLGIPEIQDFAANTTAAADVVIFSVSGARTLPTEVREWIDKSSWSGDSGNPSVVALFAGADDEQAPLYGDLRRAVMNKGVGCFARAGCVTGADGALQDKQFSTMGIMEVKGGDTACG